MYIHSDIVIDNNSVYIIMVNMLNYNNYGHVCNFREHTETIIFLEQPQSLLAPVGTQVEVTCRVAMGYRIVWIVVIPGVGEVNTEESGAISALSSRGIETEISSAENREPTLTITGTVEVNQLTLQCRAVNVSDSFQRSDGDVVIMTFYGKTINNWSFEY